MKGHFGVDSRSKLIHAVVATPGQWESHNLPKVAAQPCHVANAGSKRRWDELKALAPSCVWRVNSLYRRARGQSP
jgi:hypothetical protein